MAALGLLTLLVNGLAVPLALGLLLVVLWQDAHRALNIFFALFLFSVTTWSVGTLLGSVAVLATGDTAFVVLAANITELGFAASCGAVYLLCAALSGLMTTRMRVLGLVVFGVLLAVLLLFQRARGLGVPATVGALPTTAALVYLTFATGTLSLLWRYRRRMGTLVLRLSLAAFVVGQGMSLLNPVLGGLALGSVVGTVAALMASLALLRQEVIKPLSARVAQVEAMHHVSLAIASNLAIDHVLQQIVAQAAGWLNADAAALYLAEGHTVRLATVHGLPSSYAGLRFPLGHGVAGQVVVTQRTLQLDHFDRLGPASHEMPFAREAFGAAVCVPMVFDGQALGALMVIAARQGRTFRRDDAHLLELLASQAAVALAHGRLFAEKDRLTRQLDASHGRLQAVLTSTDNPVVAVTRGLWLAFANPAAQRLLPQLRQQPGAPVASLLPAHLLPSWRAVARAVRRDGSYSYELTLAGRVFACTVAPLEGGRAGTHGWVAVLHDVSQLKELDRMKSELIRMASHDLKNPLQGAMAHTELLADALASLGAGDADLWQSVQAVQQQLRRMERIISGLLDLERVKAGARTLALCDVPTVLYAAVDELSLLAREKRVVLAVLVANEPVPAVLGDDDHLQRAVVNLVENAVKFTPADGRVVVSTDVADGGVVVRVADTGIGIPQDQQPHVFDRFYRAKQRGATHISGSGVGLSLVKVVAETHGGRVWLESQEGVGTTFTLWLPIPSTPTAPTTILAPETVP